MLMVSDRVGTNELHMTQEFLANMLGTRRTTVAEEAGELQRAGAIDYSRGVVRIVNREILEKRACECYRILKKQFDQLYKTPHTQS
jgi:Mn-dependent DtxR family transcriptional regulator